MHYWSELSRYQYPSVHAVPARSELLQSALASIHQDAVKAEPGGTERLIAQFSLGLAYQLLCHDRELCRVTVFRNQATANQF